MAKKESPKKQKFKGEISILNAMKMRAVLRKALKGRGMSNKEIKMAIDDLDSRLPQQSILTRGIKKD